jgi:uncharacterized protein (TIGR02145 family)
MKTITNTLRNTLICKVCFSSLVCLMFLLMTSCEKDKPDQVSVMTANMNSRKPISGKKKPIGKPKEGKITDIQRNVYKTVKIGDQWWMAENLKSTKYNDGQNIPKITDNTEWINLSSQAYCWYNNDISNKDTYGALYNWFTIRNGNLCPTGWHVPSDSEWLTLINFCGGEAVAGEKLKDTGTKLWIYPNTGATNQSGFTALPSGDRIGADGSFYNIGGYAIYWSSDEATFTLAINRVLVFDDTNFRIGYDNKTAGFSVRCLKDN